MAAPALFPDDLVLRRAVPLGPLTTLEVGGAADHLVEVADPGQLAAALRWAAAERLRTFVLGGGSNVVVADQGFAGLVVRLADAHLRCEPLGDGAMRVVAGAAAPWEAVVQACLEAGLHGAECLSGIPGRVGAVPVQNVGAYGQQVGDVLEAVQVLPHGAAAPHWLPAAACGLGYRTSHFKGPWAQRACIVAASFVFYAGLAPVPRYPELRAALGSPTAPLPAATVAAAVRALRGAKSMLWAADDPNRRSVGSFFVNPVVPAATAAALRQRLGAALPLHPVAGGAACKLSAAWLLEAAGFRRGLVDGPVGLSSRHALALINRGGAAAADVLRLARRLRDGVAAHCGVVLQAEPTLVGFDAPL